MRPYPLMLVLLVVFASECCGQGDPIELSRIHNSLKLDSLMTAYYDTGKSDSFIGVPFDAFGPPPQTRGSQWWNPSYYHVSIHNDSKDAVAAVIYVAKTGGMKVARVNSKGEVIEVLRPATYSGPGLFDEHYFSFSIPADSSWHVVIRAERQVLFQHVSAWLVRGSDFNTFIEAYTARFFDMAFLHCIIAGMLLMMLLYVSAQFVLFRTPEYGYYAAYIFAMLLFLFVNSWEIFELDFIQISDKWYYKINNYLQVAAYCLYFNFLSWYFNARNVDRKLHQILRIATITLLIYVSIDASLWIPGFWVPSFYWTIVRSVLAVLVIFLSFRVWGLKLPYARYPIYGGITFLLFALVALVVDLAEKAMSNVPWPFNYEIFYYFVGVAFELTFFSLGLAHKRRQDAIDKVEAQEALKLEVQQQQVRELNALSEIQEKERSRFAKDLHDGLGGMLSGVKLSLSSMKENMVLSGEYVDLFERSLDMLDSSIHELRRVAHNLMPEALVKFGLAAALKDFCDFINRSKVINVIFQQIGTYKRLEMSVEVVLYRVANELVNNTMRHSSATELIIQLNYDNNLLTMTVEDNGKGFDQAILDRGTGSGWPNIKSRIAYLKGSLDVQTSPGNGTSVNITIPI